MVSRLFPDGYGAILLPQAPATVVANIKEAAAPELEAVADKLLGVAQSASLFLVETLGINVSAPKAVELGMGMLLFFRLRHYPMAAYLVIPAYLAWSTVGWAVVSRLWERFSPGILLQLRLLSRRLELAVRLWWWRRVPWWARRVLHSRAQRLMLLLGAVAAVAAAATLRRQWRRAISEQARLGRQARRFFRQRARQFFQKETERLIAECCQPSGGAADGERERALRSALVRRPFFVPT
jgi:hypothetical protein